MTSNDIPATTRRRTMLCGAAFASAAAAGLTVTGCESRDPQPNREITEPVGLGPTDDVPVGGAALYREEKVLVSQPEAGDYRAFSAVCTHQGCVLSALRDDVAICSCHGSTFDPANGAVLQGPAEEPLPELELDTSGATMTARPTT